MREKVFHEKRKIKFSRRVRLTKIANLWRLLLFLSKIKALFHKHKQYAYHQILSSLEAILFFFSKHLYKLLLFDIKDFYPSINDKLQWEAIRFAKCHIPITIKDIEAIFHASKSLLSYKDEPCVKKVRKQLGRNNWRIRRDWGM